jgi:hypothetical protein
MLDTTAQYYGFKSRIINGNMVIDQRNAGAAVTMGTTAAGTYGVDRWAGYAGAGSLWQMQRVSTGNLDFPFAMRMQRIAGQTSTAPIYYSQVIETNNTYGLAGSPVTLSFYVTAGANYSGGSGFGFQVITGTAADQGMSSMNSGTWTGAAYPGTTLTPTTTRTLVTFTTTLGASVQEIGIRFYWAGSGTAGAADFVDITGVQLEKGSTATSFDYRPYGTELALCQRYLPAFISTGASAFVGSGYAVSSTGGLANYVFKTTARTPPTGVTVSAASDFEVMAGTSGAITTTVITFAYASTDGAALNTTVASGQTANAGAFLRGLNSSAKLLFTGCEL